MALENKFGIKDSAELARVEEKISKRNALELFTSGKLEKLSAGTFATLAEIHRALFGEIYDFAGKIRNVNLAKGHFRFASALYLNEALAQIDNMPQNNFNAIAEKYIEMNIAHPFREGNGRSMRIWLDHIFKAELGRVVDWSRIDKADYLSAMELSPIHGDKIKKLLADALTDKINDREIFMKGIDASYFYENYFTYRARELL
ncbi:MAG: Fic family protein [Selenomonadaceae bacterium]|nr:Fic family protein [Selenomonadaceae bacterium]